MSCHGICVMERKLAAHKFVFAGNVLNRTVRKIPLKS